MQKDFSKTKWLVIIALLGIVVFLWYVTFFKKENKLKVAFLDVGQGDSIFIQTPNGNQVLIDGGKNRKVLTSLAKEMSFYDRSLDIIIATHPDLDHIGGFADLIKVYNIGVFLDPNLGEKSNLYRILKKNLEKKDIPHITGISGQRIVLDQDIFLEVLFPYKNYYSEDVNENSVVLKLVYKNTSVLLTGDASRITEMEMVSFYGDKLESDILKVGHHGSKTSSSKIFIDLVSPRYSIISAGCENRYGHPNIEVIRILEDENSEILSTCEMGNIVFESDGEKFELKD